MDPDEPIGGKYLFEALTNAVDEAGGAAPGDAQELWSRTH